MTDKEKILGVWQLISVEYLSKSEKLLPYGEKPLGLLIYSENYMSVQFGIAHRTKLGSIDFANANSANKAQAFDEYMAYCGTWKIDESRKIVLHKVLQSLVPEWKDTSVKRHYKLDENVLILSSAPFVYHSESFTPVLRWLKT